MDKEELNEKGCEYGRKINMQVSNNKKEIKELKKTVVKIDDSHRKTREQLALQAGKYIVISSLLSTILALLASSIGG